MEDTKSKPPTPSPEEVEELLLCARYGEDDDFDSMKTFVSTYGAEWLSRARDERGNTCLHMCGGNGHLKIVEWILPQLTTEALTTANDAKSTPLHWIAINFHLPVLRLLCPLLPPHAFDVKNAKGKTALEECQEACESWTVPEGEEKSDRGRERVRREVVAAYLMQCMGLLGDDKNDKDKEEGSTSAVSDGVKDLSLG